MTDDLVKRPVLRIYTEATSGNGGLWAFSPYKSVHTVFVEESNYRDLEDRIEALTAERDQLYERWNDCQEKRMAAVARAEAAEAERDAMAAERDCAIIHLDAARKRSAARKTQIKQLEAVAIRWKAAAQGASRHIAKLEADHDRLREALKPFANYAKSLKGWEPTEAVCSETGIDFERMVTAGDFFAARAALKGQQP